jgi:ubiquinone/menaquinone biosynthesis C-methylase UbiE
MNPLVFKKTQNDELCSFGDVARLEWLKNCIQKIPSEKRILDAGAGEMRYKPLCNHLHYVSQDFGLYDGKGNEIGVQKGTWNSRNVDILCDITNIPEPDGSFDAVMCVAVLEHLANPIAAITEFSRLLTKNGYLILTAPFASTTHFAPHHFYSGFTRYFYENHLLTNGFNIIELNPNGNLFDYIKVSINHLPMLIKHFTGKELNANGLTAIKSLSEHLRNASQEDKGSNELLNFGYQIFAIKN